MPGLHAKLAPSAAKRWRSCTASPLYVAALLDANVIEGDKDSVYSLEGTEAHDWAQKFLTGKVEAEDIPENFRPHILEYDRVCQEVEHGADSDASIRLIEAKLPLFYSPTETGTVDYGFARVNADGVLESITIRDLKYGAGVPVDAEENPQLAIYAMGFINDLESWWGRVEDHIPVSIGIHQPRYTGDDTLKLWETTAGELREFCKPIGKTARKIMKAAHHDDLEFAPSVEVCQFCPAKAVCKARMDSAFEDFPSTISADLMNNLDLEPVDSVPQETLVALWKQRKAIAKYLSDVEEHLTALANAGHPAPGTKLVEGREGNRAWKDEQVAGTFLSRYLSVGEAYVAKLISPAQAEKSLKGKLEKPAIEGNMSKLTERPEGKQVLAPDEDKRPAIEPAVKHFSVITDEEEDD